MAKRGGEEALHGVPLTNLDAPLFDGAEATKRDLVDYLDAVSDRILPVLEDRPLSVIRVHRGQDAFMQKVLEKRLDIEVQAAQAEQGYSDFEQESNQTVRQVRELGKTGMDVTATYQGRTASGNWNVEVRKSNYTLYIAIAAIIGIVALVIVLRM